MRLSTLLALLSLLCAALPAQAVDDFDILGQYERVSPPQAAGDAQSVEVLEVFWYKCPHCYRFLPYMQAYEADKPDHVTVRRMPAVLAEDWRVQARAFYAASSMGALDRLHGPLFDAVHQGGRSMDEPEQVKRLFLDLGVEEAEFDRHYRGFSVDAQVRKAEQLTRAYGVNGVPTLIINGRYRTSGALAGSFERALEVAAVLVEMERERLGIPAAP